MVSIPREADGRRWEGGTERERRGKVKLELELASIHWMAENVSEPQAAKTKVEGGGQVEIWRGDWGLLKQRAQRRRWKAFLDLEENPSVEVPSVLSRKTQADSGPKRAGGSGGV